MVGWGWWCSCADGRSHGSSGTSGSIDGTAWSVQSVSNQSKSTRTHAFAGAGAKQSTLVIDAKAAVAF